MSARHDARSVLDEAIRRGGAAEPWVAAVVLAGAVAVCWLVVYASGGSHTATPHVFYVPIILATVPFGLRGSVAVALASAVAVGPLMPLDVAAGTTQPAYSWLVRALLFVAVGSVASLSLAVRQRFYDQQLSSEIRSALSRTATGPTVDAALLPLVPQVLAERRFHPVYQPIYSLRDGRLIGVEALTRFDAEPSRTPDLWFAAAAGAGQGVALELAAIEEAVAGATDLPATVTLSVNASPATIADPGLLEIVRAAGPRRITVEITEHAVIEDYPLLTARIAALREAGAWLAVDDTGAGVASLQHIVQLAPEVIKLDLSLTQHVGSSPFRRAMAGAIIEFAHASGALLVVEGVEEQADLTVWSTLGAHAVQGYLVGRPAPLPAEPRSPLIAAGHAA